MPRRRTIYYDDARHFFLWNFEPPMDVRDAHVPVDQVAGTAVDTFIYGVARDDGLFYGTKASTMFGSDQESFASHYAWRAHHCLQSLADRGLDMLSLLVDRAHEKGMEFIASLRLGGYATMPKEWSTREGGAAGCTRRCALISWASCASLPTTILPTAWSSTLRRRRVVRPTVCGAKICPSMAT